MSKNKTAQILAAVMCASSILGGYTVVSAQSFTQGNSTVNVNDDEIKASVQDGNSNKSTTITVGGNSLAIDVGKNEAGAFGIFEFNSKNLEIKNDVGLVVKDSGGNYVGGISNSGEIGGKGLTVITPGATTQIKVDSKNIYFQGNKEKNGIIYGTDFIQDGTAIISQAAKKDTSSGNGFKSSLAVNSDDVILKSESSKDGVISNAATISLRGETGNILMTSDKNIKIESEEGTIFENPNNKDKTLIDGGTVTADEDVELSDGTSLKKIGANTQGIERKEVTTIDGTTGYATTIEGKTVIGSDGSFSTAGGKFTVEKDGRVSVNGSVNASGDVVTWDGNNQKYSLNTIGDKTEGIERKEVTTIDGTTGYATTIEGKTVIGSDGSFSTAGGKFTVEKDGRVSVNGSVNASGDVVTWDGNNQKYSLNTIGETVDRLYGTDGDITALQQKTAGIERKEVTTIDGTTGYATTIEGKTVIGSDGSFSTAGGKFTVEKDGRVSVNGSVNASGDVVTWDGNNQKYSLNTIGDKTEGIERKEVTTIDGTTGYATTIEGKTV
ncbi:hypothetical protein, partial [Megamonas hypermegale]|uniref:hypothetical protein n=1 Tax=Megamonas hypermegale TaxID=158847 RepID=UPI00242BC08F